MKGAAAVVRRVLLLSTALWAAGCSTGPYLHPESVAGDLRSANRTCPGAAEARTYAVRDPAPFAGTVRVVVHATLPGSSEWDQATRSFVRTTDTRLLLRFWLYPSHAKSYQAQQAYSTQQERAQSPVLIRVSEPYLTVVTSDGAQRKILIPELQTVVDGQNRELKIRPVQLSAGRIDDFWIIFPEFFVNDKPLEIPPVHYRIKQGTYMPVFNC